MALRTLPDVLTRKALLDLISMLPQDKIRVTKHDTIITVHIQSNDRKIFSALKPTRRDAWHVMADEGLFIRTEVKS